MGSIHPEGGGAYLGFRKGAGTSRDAEGVEGGGDVPGIATFWCIFMRF